MGLAFVARLHRSFESRRQQLLAKGDARQKECGAGVLPDFLPETKAIREGNGSIAPQPADLLHQRAEITGPTDRKMVIDALNCPRWETMIEGEVNLRGAVRRRWAAWRRRSRSRTSQPRCSSSCALAITTSSQRCRRTN